MVSTVILVNNNSHTVYNYFSRLQNISGAIIIICMTEHEKFVKEIAAFLRKHRMKPTQFSVLAKQRRNFVADLIAGRDALGQTMTDVRKFMKDYRPPATRAKKKSDESCAA